MTQDEVENTPCSCGGKVKILSVGYTCPLIYRCRCESCGSDIDRHGDGIKILNWEDCPLEEIPERWRADYAALRKKGQIDEKT